MACMAYKMGDTHSLYLLMKLQKCHTSWFSVEKMSDGKKLESHATLRSVSYGGGPQGSVG